MLNQPLEYRIPMRLAVHIILVGFDRDRLVIPITKGQMTVHKVHLLRGKGDDSEQKNMSLASSMASLVRRDLLVATALTDDDITEQFVEVHDYESAYTLACTLYSSELAQDRDVFVNISSMPRTVSFAFATAANNMVVQDERLQGRLHVYYAAPAEYLVVPMIESIQEQTVLMERLLRLDLLPENVRQEVEQIYARSRTRLQDLQNFGTTKGVKPIAGSYQFEIPFTPSGELREFEARIVEALARGMQAPSVSQLAAQLAVEIGPEQKQIKSKVIYNIRTLEKKGFVEVDEHGRNKAPHLTAAGRLWVRHHMNPTT